MKLTTLTLLAASMFSTNFVNGSPAQATYYCPDPYDSVPLLRGYSPSSTDHFYTTNSAEMTNAVKNAGYSREGNAARVFSAQEPSTIPLYRVFSLAAGDHFYTTSAPERNNAIDNLGYKDEGVAAYIYTSDECGGEPLFRLYNSNAKDHFYTMSAAERDSAVGLGYVLEGIAGYALPA
ncbi:hypothetical protein VKT23_019714 [Stygiomarasmius scandens]|uniref:DUF5648 domain-containing protein n=1 Tax=Marasmiellus scandens TaxID=2682957 RepID=A0ABR1IKQ1_9AGAR